MKHVAIYTAYGGTGMKRDQAIASKKIDQYDLPPHLYEFFITSAKYLGVEVGSLNKEVIPWASERNVEAWRNKQEVCYATDSRSA
jgi:hypothetical protein